MGSYKDRLTADMKVAMKAKDKEKLGTLRMVLAAIKGAQDAKGVDSLSEEDELLILQKAVKTRRDAIAQAETAGRKDVIDSEAAEIDVIQAYLPEMLTGDALVVKVKEVAGEVGYSGPGDTGKFMQAWMAKYKGRAEGREVQEALKGLS